MRLYEKPMPSPTLPPIETPTAPPMPTILELSSALTVSPVPVALRTVEFSRYACEVSFTTFTDTMPDTPSPCTDTPTDAVTDTIFASPGPGLSTAELNSNEPPVCSTSAFKRYALVRAVITLTEIAAPTPALPRPKATAPPIEISRASSRAFTLASPATRA